MRLAGVSKLWRLIVLRRSGGAQNVHHVFLWSVRVGLYGGVLRNTHEIPVRERIVVALRELFGEICPKGKRSVAGTRSQKRRALARLNPAQESIPVRFLKFGRHIKRLTSRTWMITDFCLRCQYAICGQNSTRVNQR